MKTPKHVQDVMRHQEYASVLRDEARSLEWEASMSPEGAPTDDQQVELDWYHDAITEEQIILGAGRGPSQTPPQPS